MESLRWNFVWLLPTVQFPGNSIGDLMPDIVRNIVGMAFLKAPDSDRGFQV
jgi:hypothetical protein